MLDRFHDIDDKLADLEGRLSDPSLINNQQEYQKVVKEHAHLSRLSELLDSHRDLEKQIDGNRALLQDDDEDPEIRELAELEIEELTSKLLELENDIQAFLLPKDPNDDKNIFLEIRAGTGGDEAALFVGDLFRMYGRYAESKNWRVEIMSSSPLGIGGFKEIIAMISGDQVYSKLKFESGVHRVQRVPETEAQG
ncbi:MAG: PCRF domain-containing protein, partial [Desulfobulbaceae bacterium]